jgi:serine/threonine protein kinase
MSPEQVEHRPIDQRSDVFSFGCIACQALTGNAPFERGSIIDTFHAIVHSDPPALADIVPDAPAILVEIVEQCLQKSPDARPQSMREVAAQLQDIARATDPKSMIKLPQARRRLSPAGVAGAVFVFVVGAALVAFALKRQSAHDPFDAMRITRMASSGRSTFTAISPDVSNIWLQPLDGTEARQLTRFEDGQIFHFDRSADGRDLVASRGDVTSNVVLIDGFR